MRQGLSSVFLALLCVTGLTITAPLLGQEGLQGPSIGGTALNATATGGPGAGGEGATGSTNTGGVSLEWSNISATSYEGNQSAPKLADDSRRSGSATSSGSGTGVATTGTDTAPDSGTAAGRTPTGSEPPTAEGRGSSSGGAGTIGPVAQPYWRTAAFSEYTGTGWARPTPTEAYTGPREASAPASTRQQYRVELRQPSRQIPAPWQPVAVDGVSADTLEVRSTGGVVATAPLAAGEDPRVTSARADWTVAQLNASGRAYPTDIQRRYTQLPSDTPPQLAATTTRLTASATTPLQTAVAIEYWLQTNKEYSLKVNRPSSHIATNFLTRMDQGYCQYFASTMVAMLRTQNIPARYVVGYAPSETAANGTSIVRHSYAHAWVEVYFPDVGWVTFDPTPPDRQTQRDTGGESALVDTRGVSVRTAAALDIAVTTTDDWEQIDATIETSDEAIPGTTITVTATRNGRPLEGHQVRFNGDAIGTTDANGQVRGTVPYTAQLNITVYAPVSTPTPTETPSSTSTPTETSSSGQTPADSGTATSQSAVGAAEESSSITIAGSLEPPPRTVVYHITPTDSGTSAQRSAPAAATRAATVRPGTQTVTAAMPRREPTATGALVADDDETTIDVPTDIDLTTSGPTVAGQAVTVRATIEGVPVPNATLTVGDRTYTTDEAGYADISYPYAETATLNATRGETSGERTVELATRASLDVESGTTPGTSVVLTATVASFPFDGAAVLVNGEQATTTSANGTATVTLPYTEELNITVVGGPVRAETTRTLTTTASVTVASTPIPSQSVVTRATVNGEPVPNARVYRNGAPIGRTNGSGALNLTVPFNESLNVTVTRGAVRGQTETAVPTDLSLATDTRLPVPLPGSPATVTATIQSTPVSGLPVTGGGTTIQTDQNGTAQLTIPVVPPRASLTVEAARGAVTGTTQIERVWLGWLSVLGIVVGAVLLAETRLSLSRRLRGAVGDTRGTLARLRQTLTRSMRRTRELTRSLVRTLVELFDRASTSLTATIARLQDSRREFLRRLISTLRTLPADIVAWLRALRRDPAESGPSGRNRDGAVFAGRPIADLSTDERDAIEKIIEAWNTLLTHASVRYPRRVQTVIRRAVEAGYPDDAARTIARAYQEVQFGHRPPSQRVEAVMEAKQRLVNNETTVEEESQDE